MKKENIPFLEENMEVKDVAFLKEKGLENRS